MLPVAQALPRGQDRKMKHAALPATPDPSDAGKGWGRPVRLGVLASGSGSKFEALVQRCRGEQPPLAQVELLIVNKPGCGAIERAQRLGVPWILLDHRQQPSREALDGAIVAALTNAAIELVVMAGWMRIVTSVLIQAYPGRLINIHPSLLPSFRGADAIGQALAAGATESGCTVHEVVEAVDAGPILAQAPVPILANDDHASLAARIQQQEHRILPEVVLARAQQLRPRNQG